jgi:hypothetical protein
MARIGSVILGAGLVVVWIAGLNQAATVWLTWMLGLTGLATVVIDVMLPERHGHEGAKVPAAIGFALFALWIVGVTAHATPWLTWWTFAFGFGHFAIAAVEARQGSAPFHRRGQLHRRVV